MADSIFEPEISRSLKRFAATNTLECGIAIECKKETGTSLAFDRVKSHQVQALIDFKSLPFVHKMRVAASVGGYKSRFQLDTGFDFLACPPGKSFVLVNFRATKKDAGKDIPKGTNRCFAVTIEDFNEHKERLLSEGRKSFPYSWFLEYALELERIRWTVDDKYVYGWDLNKLFGGS